MTKTPTITGLQIIREALESRKSQMAVMARDCGCSMDILDSFSQGRATLPPAILDRVVRFIWNGFIVYNAEADVLQAVPQDPPRSVGVPPPPLKIATLPFTNGPPPRGPQPEIAPKPAKRRAGWG